MARKKTPQALPKGFAPITRSGDSWPNDDTKKGDVLQGTVIEYEFVKTKYSDEGDDSENLCHIEADDGKTYKVWICGALRGLFEEDYTDSQVWIRYDGVGPATKIGRKMVHPKMFTPAFKE